MRVCIWYGTLWILGEYIGVLGWDEIGCALVANRELSKLFQSSTGL
jgi:hypothetical protein